VTEMIVYAMQHFNSKQLWFKLRYQSLLSSTWRIYNEYKPVLKLFQRPVVLS